MAQSIIEGVSIRGVATSVPGAVFHNMRDASTFPKEEIRKVVAMAGVTERRVADSGTCSSDLCLDAAELLLSSLGWSRDSIDGLVMITQTPDYFMPSTSCVLHKRLGLSDRCAAFDVGLGCSGYPYGLWMAGMMLSSGGFRRVLLLHGETPTRYAEETDRAVSLLFGDAGSATALERDETAVSPWYFTLHTDGTGFDDLIVDAGGFRDRFCADTNAHYVRMNGANVFNFTIKVIPALISDTLRLAEKAIGDVDYYVFHQSNRFILNHLITTCQLPPERVPLVLDRFGNAGGPSVPLTITQGLGNDAGQRPLSLMVLGYGAGLSWAAAIVPLPEGAVVGHTESGSRAGSVV